MVVNRRVTGTAVALPAGVGIGVSTATVLTLLGVLAAAWLVDGTYLQETGIGYGAMVILLISAMAGAWLAATLVQRQRIQVCAAVGGLYFLVLLGITALCFGGQYQGIVPTALLIAGGSLAAALIGNIGQGNRTPRRHKRRTG